MTCTCFDWQVKTRFILGLFVKNAEAIIFWVLSSAVVKACIV